MAIWSAEIKELEKLSESIKSQFTELEKELGHLVKTEDENVIMLYSRRCLEVIITDLCECELKRPRKTEPLKGIIDKLHKEEKVPSHIVSSMHGLNELSTYGAHPKDFDPEQVKPVLVNLDIIIKWYLKYKEAGKDIKVKQAEEVREEIKNTTHAKKNIRIPKKRLIGLVSGLTLLIVIMISIIFLTNNISNRKKSKELEKSIAVLPFFNDSPDSENASYINGLMGEILNNLSRIKELGVRPRTSVEKYRNPERPPAPQIGKELNVSYLVDGRGQKYGNIIQLTVELIDAAKDRQIWTDTYKRDLKDAGDFFTIQSQVAKTIAAELKTIISPDEKQLIEKTATTNLTAYYLYQKGREEHLNFWLNINNKNAFIRARKYYIEALKFDSAYAQAYSGLAMLELMKYNTWSVNTVGMDYFTSEYMDSALNFANRALTYDANLAESYYVKGLYYWNTGKEENVLDYIDKASEYNPNDWMVYEFMGFSYYQFSIQDQDYIKAIENLKKALDLNHGREIPGLLHSLGLVYSLIAGFPEEGKKCFIRALMLNGDSAEYFNALGQLESNFNDFDNSIKYYTRAFKIDSTKGSFEGLGTAYVYSGRYKESLEYINKYAEWLKENQVISEGFSHRIGYVYWINGYKDEADYWFNEQKRYCEESIKNKRFSGQISLTAYYDLACVYAFRDEKQKAYENLRVLGQLKVFPSWWLDLIKRDPLLENLRGEPEFERIVNDIRTKYQAEHERVKKWLEDQEML
jgi:TolB-like protein/tetratricopeptide (TPR) repeat protein